MPSWLELPRLVALLYIVVCPIFQQIKGNELLRMGALSWVNVERAPNLPFGRLVRCFDHGHSLARLWYIYMYPTQWRI